MQHYHQAHNMTFKGAKLDFIGGKMIRRQQTTPVVNSHVGNVQGSNQQQVSNGLYPNASIAPYRGDLQVMQHTTTTSTSYRPRSFLPAPPAPAQQYGRPGFRTGYGQHPKTYTSDACRILTNFGI
ncbi:hypothetical protein VKT23_011708 [Stygiomarasmius scandens]|uniref:Uncharacterized protein n=1 Tax=Marasmiellus scandens TaxID=2682957 RepID=A0ABR1JCX2_9AGAR